MIAPAWSADDAAAGQQVAQLAATALDTGLRPRHRQAERGCGGDVRVALELDQDDRRPVAIRELIDEWPQARGESRVARFGPPSSDSSNA